MARIFGYRGYLGITAFKDEDSNEFSEGLINDPMAKGQIGFVYDISKCQFNEQALDLLKKIKPSGDDIGDVDIYRSNNITIICWLGGPMTFFPKDAIENEPLGSSVYNASNLDSIKPTELEIPVNFISHVDILLDGVGS